MATPTFKTGSVSNYTTAGGSGSLTMVNYVCPALTEGYMFVAFGIYHDGAAQIDTVVFNSTTNLAPIDRYQPTSQSGAELWGVKAPPNATGNIVATFSLGLFYAVASVWLYEGVDQTTPLGTAAHATTASGTSFTVDAASVSGDLVIGAVGGSTGAAQTTSWTSATERADYSDSSTADVSTAERVAEGATTTMAGTVTTSGELSVIAVALKGTAVAGGQPQILVVPNLGMLEIGGG
jgi:hypothetical protein